jgi:hypothetical protein
MLTACEKEQDQNQLKVHYIKSQSTVHQKGIQNLPEGVSINLYPNPFLNETNFSVTGAGAKEIVVTNDEGKFKVIPITDTNFKLDFSEEEQGSYYGEIKVGNEVVPITLIKAE